MKRLWLVVLAAILVSAVVWGAIVKWRSADAVEESTGGDGESAVDRSRVTLTAEKRAAGNIQTIVAGPRSFQHLHTLPGRVQYDETRHVELRAASDGVLQYCAVKPGDRVVQGQQLAVLSCPEIGGARADVLQRQAEMEIARQKLTWKQETSRNVQQLVAEIRDKKSLDDIEKQFRGRSLGDARESLLATYARLALAEGMLTSIESAAESGAVALRTLRERSSERQAAEAALRAACEQTEFDARQEAVAAQAEFQDACRRWEIARQHVTTLLGYEDPGGADPGGEKPGGEDRQGEVPGGEDPGSADPWSASPAGAPEAAEARRSLLPPSLKPGRNLSLVECRAPISGTIESKLVAVTERVRRGEPILVLADTSQLWVVADIRERDWQAVDLQAGQPLTLDFPAIPGRQFAAEVYYCGREVLPGTNAVPLVAAMANPEGVIRPGLFVRVSVPIGPPRDALAVPTRAIVEHEGVKFVFVADGELTFQRVDVTTGEQSEQWTEIKAGLAAGAVVVDQGAFLLKSELLLEREE